jgi:hypothetical protein
MKQNQFITIFLAVNVVFIFLHIHKHVRFVQHSFEKQRYERMLAQLEKERDVLTNQLYTLQNRSDIKAFAQETLHLRPIALSQIKKLDNTATAKRDAIHDAA